MPNKIILSEETIDKIILLYKNGNSSITISKILSISKPKILKILKEKKLTKNRLHSNEFYSNFWFDNGMWCGNWVCNNCNKNILFKVKEKSLINRNIKRKKICKKCSLEKQIGKGNPFYGKKHSKDTILKMLKSQHKTIKPISKDEIKIFNTLVCYGYDVEQQKIVGKPFDFFLPKFNLLIEYNGDYWHCNPEKYKFDFLNKKKNKTAKEIWDYDNKKLYLAKNNGYNCEVIWESDYKKNNNIVLEILKKYENK